MFKVWDFKRWLTIIFAIFLTTNVAHATESDKAQSLAKANGKILVVMTNHLAYPSRSDKTGLWLTELTHFYDVASAAGYEMDFVSPLGGQVPLDERSLKSIYLDKSARQHLADPAFMQKLKMTLAPNTINPIQYKAIYYTGGHGTMWDFPNNKALQNISEQIYRQGGIVSAVCHGVGGLLPLQDENGKPLIAGRKVTGFANIEETLSGIKSQVPFSLQNELIERGANYKQAFIPFTSYVVSDNRIITGQNPQSSKEIAEAVVKRLSSIQ
ncbi:type 1 glutamine amidotransferase domain-containing protein [Acinetobacter baumannii]|uniref:type 1 glutamine amidotransferase domain-containing protein n=1 Tax=Acinetobacter baumannii TaxID=470 RepID=UPI000F683FF6|nr:type 1 glutamine amidotransferase domain-containing protein [Acinetobacter baumannii]EHU3266821.1 type 1 glutamine amidotransferase domain-containing protein [Acinetobacter baumannii]MDC4342596.1 type 1 glutamine amidotransferase domain-containing protein [Acinetobacter baumannii]MDN8302256.1 type 1 glutamine amidotransferase domain-containing protein [Acinetobacter baumannii]MDN8312794.1 type 1 glutamine amidotransferase domain-containing protein [Acinetobacter baumannii]MDN8327603.1 type 